MTRQHKTREGEAKKRAEEGGCSGGGHGSGGRGFNKGKKNR